jgi:tetratricopeptide (TPR) repeat protein
MKKIIILISVVISLFALDVKKAYYDSYNYEKMGDYKDAIKVLIPVYKKYPNGYTLNLRLGWLFYLSKKYQNALDHYKKASLVAPYSIEAKLGIMRTYLAAGDYNNALKVGDVILKTDYYNYYGNYYEVVALIAEKQYKVALQITNKMLTLYPTSVLFLVELGKIYYVIDKAKAKKIFEDVLILDPNNITAKEYLSK